MQHGNVSWSNSRALIFCAPTPGGRRLEDNMVKKSFKIDGMHCISCAINIDGELEDTEGVKSASTNFAKGMVEVEYDSSKLSDKDVIKTIKTAGYSAELTNN